MSPPSLPPGPRACKAAFVCACGRRGGSGTAARVPAGARGGSLVGRGTQVRLRCAAGAVRGHIWRSRPVPRPPPGAQWRP